MVEPEIGEDLVTGAAPEIAAGQANSAVVAGRIEADPGVAVGVGLFRASTAAAVRRAAPASAAAPAGPAVAVVVDPAAAQEVGAEAAVEVEVEDAAAAEGAGKKVSSDECQVASGIPLDTRFSTLVSHWWRTKWQFHD